MYECYNSAGIMSLKLIEAHLFWLALLLFPPFFPPPYFARGFEKFSCVSSHWATTVEVILDFSLSFFTCFPISCFPYPSLPRIPNVLIRPNFPVPVRFAAFRCDLPLRAFH